MIYEFAFGSNTFHRNILPRHNSPCDVPEETKLGERIKLHGLYISDDHSMLLIVIVYASLEIPKIGEGKSMSAISNQSHEHSLFHEIESDEMESGPGASD